MHVLELPSFCNIVVSRTVSPCFWLDLKRRAVENIDFIWSDGTSFNGFMDIFQLDSNFSARRDDCVCAFKSNGQFIARSLSCLSSAAYVCRLKGAKTTVASKRAVIKTQATRE